MPSSATITSFITMVAGSKARASHVNTNFSNFRGHSLPIDPNTAAAIGNTYDLGSAEHPWRRIYVQQTPFINGAQLGKLHIEALFDSSSPADLIEDVAWLGRTAFQADTATGVHFNFTVPDDFTPGNRLSLNIKGFCQTGGSHITMQTESALYRPGTTVGTPDPPTNIFTSTSNINPPTTSGIVFSDTSLRISNTGGIINGITVAAGDVIAVKLQRTGAATGDTNAGYFYMTDVIVDLNN